MWGKADKKIKVSDDDIVAVADARLFNIEEVSDPAFSEKMMGDGAAFDCGLGKVEICSPANGVLTAFFPTGHAFGITMKNGTELLVHVGFDTVDAGGKGFTLGKFKQDDEVKTGDVIVTADFKKLSKDYDCTVVLVNTTTAEHPVDFIREGQVKRGDSVIKS